MVKVLRGPEQFRVSRRSRRARSVERDRDMNSMSTRRFRCTHKPVHPVSLGGSLGAGAALLGVLFGPAPVVGAAPSGPSSVDQVVRQLKAQGYAVVVNRFGTG